MGEKIHADADAERARNVAVCMSQVRMLEAAGAHEQAKGAQLCADVLGLLTPIAPTHRHEVLGEIDAERTHQDAKWGEQNHPDVDRVLTAHGIEQKLVGFAGGCTSQRMAEEYGVPTAYHARSACDGAARIGQCTWAHILVEEVAEAIEAGCESQQGRASVDALRAELVQVAAVAVSWIEAIDRRAVKP